MVHWRHISTDFGRIHGNPTPLLLGTFHRPCLNEILKKKMKNKQLQSSGIFFALFDNEETTILKRNNLRHEKKFFNNKIESQSKTAGKYIQNVIKTMTCLSRPCLSRLCASRPCFSRQCHVCQDHFPFVMAPCHSDNYVPQ